MGDRGQRSRLPDRPGAALRSAAVDLLRTPLGRYRLIAWVVGVGLVVLVCIGVPLRYLAGFHGVVAVVGPLHGFLYIVYLLVVLDLTARYRLALWRAVVVAAAGTIPFASFFAERWMSRQLAGREPDSYRSLSAWVNGRG